MAPGRFQRAIKQRKLSKEIDTQNWFFDTEVIIFSCQIFYQLSASPKLGGGGEEMQVFTSAGPNLKWKPTPEDGMFISVGM